MSDPKNFQHVSQAPTHPSAKQSKTSFDVANLYGESTADESGDASKAARYDEKLRQTYFWITNRAIISPFYDIEYNDHPPQEFTFGDSGLRLTLPTDQSYSSYVLLPLLNLATCRRCLLVGGPGRGKTAIAVLLGVIAGYSLQEVRRGIQHGQPQMTIADLLGNPLPSTLIDAESMDDVKIAWRKWLGMRIKIIDEYNRIPTRTQSALLTVMGDNYAELYDQIYECPEAAWYLTANDDAGGGTYQVIEALRDRIDVVVKALHFNTRFLSDLVTRIENSIHPAALVPDEIQFTDQELKILREQIKAVHFPRKLQRRLEFFASHFEFFEPGAARLEYMTKDTVKLAALDWHIFEADSTGQDARSELGRQTHNGLSVRALMTCILFVKAMAYFRGANKVGFEDLRQILPFVLHDKLVPNEDAPFFEEPGHRPLRSDKISWIRQLFDDSCREFERLDMDKNDEVGAFEVEFNRGLEGLTARDVRRRMAAIERTLTKWSQGRKLYGHLYDDLLKLKYLHQRYTNYLRWLKWQNQ